MSEYKKIMMILNPDAGRKQARKFLPEIISTFTNYGYEVMTFITGGAGETEKYIKKHGHGMDIIACSGGDGTFNEAVSGVLAIGEDIPVGYIPSGSTNDFASSLHLPMDIMTAANDIMSGHKRTLDIGSFNGRYFSYVASFGAFSNISYATPQPLKNALGHMAYIFEGMKEVAQITSEHVKLKTESAEYEGDYLVGIISNSTSVGGTITLNPDEVDMNDGMFEIMLVHNPNSLIELQQIITAIRSQNYYDNDMITFARGSHIEIELSKDVDWSLDGEYQEGAEKIVVENLRSSINVIVGDGTRTL